MRGLLLVSLALGTISARGDDGVPTAPRYDDRSLVLGEKLDRLEDPELRTRLRVLSRGTIERIERRAPDGSVSPVTIGELETPELLGALMAVAFELRGSENDLIVRDIRGQRYPVSVWWDAPRTLTVQAGKPWVDVVPDAPTADQLRERYKLTGLVDGDTPWDPVSIGLLNEALSRLSAEELARLRGVPFVRQRHPSAEIVAHHGSVPAAGYVYDGEGPRLELYDAAVTITDRFAGTPDKPHRYTLNVLLHEMGHAIAHAERRGARRAVEAKILRQRELYERSSSAWEHLEGLRKRIRSAEDRQTYARALERFEADRDENNRLTKEIEVEAKRVQAAAATPTPAAAALGKVLRRDGPPTFYGLSSADEAFADSFALFHGDPAALERARPSASRWFREGGHLAAARKP